MRLERRTAQIRATNGRTLSGLALPYGVETHIGEGLERFEPGSASTTGDAILNLGHDAARVLAREPGTLAFEESDAGLRMTAQLPKTHDADDAIELIRDGIVDALSVEFIPVRERREGSTRVIEAATITGCGIVARAAYQTTFVEIEGRGAALAAALAGAASGAEIEHAATAAGITVNQLRRALRAFGQLFPEPAARARPRLPRWATAG